MHQLNNANHVLSIKKMFNILKIQMIKYQNKITKSAINSNKQKLN